MQNIASLDKERLLLNNKSLKACFQLSSNTRDETILFNEDWGKLLNTDKAVFDIQDKDEILCSIKLESTNDSSLDESKPLTCVIPSTCLPSTVCVLKVNGQKKTIKTYSKKELSRFFNLPFELPPGTKEITIEAEGTPGTQFAIKEIQIWQ